MKQEDYNNIKSNKDPKQKFVLTGQELYNFGKMIAEETVQKMMNETLITRTQVREYLQVSNQTLTHWEKAGRLKAASVAGNKYLYRLSEVKAIAGN